MQPGRDGRVRCSAWLGGVVIGCNAKTLTLSVRNWLNARRGIGLRCVYDPNLDDVSECETSVKPLQVLLVADTANSKTYDVTAGCVDCAGQRDAGHDQPIVPGRGNANPLSVQ